MAAEKAEADRKALDEQMRKEADAAAESVGDFFAGLADLPTLDEQHA